jgi:hypothetical protein
MGGFEESTDQGTAAYSLQSPSFFINVRNTQGRSNSLRWEGLFQLGQQHCFGVYTLPELPDNWYNNKNSSSPAPVFTRHQVFPCCFPCDFIFYSISCMFVFFVELAFIAMAFID